MACSVTDRSRVILTCIISTLFFILLVSSYSQTKIALHLYLNICLLHLKNIYRERCVGAPSEQALSQDAAAAAGGGGGTRGRGGGGGGGLRRQAVCRLGARVPGVQVQQSLVELVHPVASLLLGVRREPAPGGRRQTHWSAQGERRAWWRWCTIYITWMKRFKEPRGKA